MLYGLSHTVFVGKNYTYFKKNHLSIYSNREMNAHYRYFSRAHCNIVLSALIQKPFVVSRFKYERMKVCRVFMKCLIIGFDMTAITGMRIDKAESLLLHDEHKE